MYYLIDNNNKIIFGWSAKAGCSHIKRLFYYLTSDNTKYFSHGLFNCNYLPENLDDYIIIIFIRNPYKRLVSGFLDKYKKNGSYRHLWSDEKILTFKNFVEELCENKFKMIEEHHFTLQLSEAYEERINNHNLIIYDIENIDYNYIENLYKKKIPDEILNYRGPCHIGIKNIYYNVYNIDIDKYNIYNIDLKYFYNDYIKELVYEFYKKDFDYFKSKNFNYELFLPNFKINYNLIKINRILNK